MTTTLRMSEQSTQSRRQGKGFVVATTLITASFAFATYADDGASQSTEISTSQAFTFLVLMLGPFKIIGPFAKLTKDVDALSARKLAWLGTFYASLMLLVASLIGERILRSYGIPLPVLALSAGVILFLVALRGVLEQFTSPPPHDGDSAGTAYTEVLALSPLAYPMIVTPYGIATLVVFLALGSGLKHQLVIGSMVLAIMGLNLVVMTACLHVSRGPRVLLRIVGDVLGVIQVALGLQIINNSLRALGVL